MKTDRHDALQAGRWFRLPLYVFACVCLAVSAQASNNSGLLPALGQDSGDFSLAQGLSFLLASTPFLILQVCSPVVGLLLAVGVTHFLRRQRSAQMETLKTKAELVIG